MKKKIIVSILGVLCVCSLVGCNNTSRYLGGNQTIELPKGQKLEEITWKDSDL